MIVGIDIPEGYEIDLDKSTATNIVLKKKEEKTQWRFATEAQAKSALAMSRIGQIIANDKRFGGPITEEEWANFTWNKFCISRGYANRIVRCNVVYRYEFLAFHTEQQRDLFWNENMNLIMDYFMLTHG